MKTYTPETLMKLSDRQLRRLMKGPDKRCVKIGYPRSETTYPMGQKMVGKKEIVEEMEWLHEYIKDEQVRRFVEE